MKHTKKLLTDTELTASEVVKQINSMVSSTDEVTDSIKKCRRRNKGI